LRIASTARSARDRARPIFVLPLQNVVVRFP
jgi:hypothetical protein